MLGAEHPKTLTLATNHAGVLEAQGELSEAARINRETLELKRCVLAAEHPGTPTSASNLASVQG